MGAQDGLLWSISWSREWEWEAQLTVPAMARESFGGL